MANPEHMRHNLTCCCCGNSTKGRQWWNRDTGYGLCDNCIVSCSVSDVKMGDIAQSYGIRGYHWDVSPKQIKMEPDVKIERKTPRHDKLVANFSCPEDAMISPKEFKKLEIELNAANALNDQLTESFTEIYRQLDLQEGVVDGKEKVSVTVMRAISDLKEHAAILQSQVDNADINLEQVQMAMRSNHKREVDKLKAEIETLQGEKSNLQYKLKKQQREY